MLYDAGRTVIVSQHQRARCPGAQPQVQSDDVLGDQERGPGSHRGSETWTGAAKLQDQSHGNMDRLLYQLTLSFDKHTGRNSFNSWEQAN
jgi:hypothetical protein